MVRCCREKGINYTGTRHSRAMGDYIPFDLLDFQGIIRVLDRESPAVVVNSTGLAGGVNFCESNPAVGRKYHIESNQVMVDWCRANDAAYVYISTDYVFDGANPPYSEEDPTRPLNYYGRYKLEGENYIREQLQRYVIARTTNVFGWDPQTRTPNFLMHLATTLREKAGIAVPSFLFGNPTYAGDLAAGIFDLLERQKFGIYHIVGPENISRYDWAVKCVEAVGFTGKTVEKIQQPPPDMVPRPLRSHLDTAKFRAHSAHHMHGVDEGLKLFAAEMKQS